MKLIPSLSFLNNVATSSKMPMWQLIKYKWNSH